MAELRSRIAACGVDPAEVQLEYSDLLQSLDIVVGGGPLPESAVSQIMAICALSGCLSFSDSRNETLRREQECRQGGVLLATHSRESRASMTDVPVYAPTQQSLAEFAVCLEADLGAQPGTLFRVEGDWFYIQPVDREIFYSSPMSVMDVVTAAIGGRRDVRVLLVGSEDAG